MSIFLSYQINNGFYIGKDACDKIKNFFLCFGIGFY